MSLAWLLACVCLAIVAVSNGVAAYRVVQENQLLRDYIARIKATGKI